MPARVLQFCGRVPKKPDQGCRKCRWAWTLSKSDLVDAPHCASIPAIAAASTGDAALLRDRLELSEVCRASGGGAAIWTSRQQCQLPKYSGDRARPASPASRSFGGSLPAAWRALCRSWRSQTTPSITPSALGGAQGGPVSCRRHRRSRLPPAAFRPPNRTIACAGCPLCRDAIFREVKAIVASCPQIMQARRRSAAFLLPLPPLLPSHAATRHWWQLTPASLCSADLAHRAAERGDAVQRQLHGALLGGDSRAGGAGRRACGRQAAPAVGAWALLLCLLPPGLLLLLPPGLLLLCVCSAAALLPLQPSEVRAAPFAAAKPQALLILAHPASPAELWGAWAGAGV